MRADTPAAPAGSLNWDKQPLPVSDDKDSDGEQETQPPPTQAQRKERLVARVAPSE